MPTLRQTIHIQHELLDMPGQAHQHDTEGGRQGVVAETSRCGGGSCHECGHCGSGATEEPARLEGAW